MARSSARISFGAKRCTFGIGQLDKLVGEQLRRGEQIAQVVIDLGHRQAERRQPVLLLQHRGELALHGGKLPLGRADLVAAARIRR